MRLRQRLLLSTIDSALKHRRRRFVRRVYICLRLLRKRTFGKCPSGTPQIKVRPMEPIWTQDAIHVCTSSRGAPPDLVHNLLGLTHVELGASLPATPFSDNTRSW
ncbi:hypothetical protein MY8738_006549 [Beauveria namnaoensis]